MLFALLTLTPFSATAKGIQILDPGIQHFRKSYNELAGAWANWAQSQPADSNALLDPDGSLCDLNQSRKFWFLAGTFGGLFGEPAVAQRTCEIPAGKAIFFPIFNFVSFAPEFTELFPDPVCDVLVSPIDEVRCDVNNDIAIAPNVALTVTLDGKKVGDLFAYRVQSQPEGFIFEIAKGSIFNALFGLPAGPRFPAVTDGYYILLKPPSPGRHEVSFRAEFGDGSMQGAEYVLFVRRRR